ncbi:MAG: hypothetical protein V7L21_14030 [Nostoc sp.]
MNIGAENIDIEISRAEWLFYSKNAFNVSFIYKYLLKEREEFC